MKVFGLVCNGLLATFNSPASIWHRRVFEVAADAEAAMPAFRAACVTDNGTARDLENLEDTDRTKVTLRELELVAPGLEKMKAALLLMRDPDDGCFGGRCYVGTADGHSPECVQGNAALGHVKDGGAWVG